MSNTTNPASATGQRNPMSILRQLLGLPCNGPIRGLEGVNIPFPVTIKVAGEQQTRGIIWMISSEYIVLRVTDYLSDEDKRQGISPSKDRRASKDDFKVISRMAVTEFSVDISNMSHKYRDLFNHALNPDLAKIERQKILETYGKEALS